MDDGTRYLRKASLSWEKLRVVYTLALLCTTIGPSLLKGKSLVRMLSDKDVLVWLALLCTVANGFYCLGPLLEIGVHTFTGRKLRGGRYVLFTAGILFMLGLRRAAGM
jgi:hypothetical protein